MTANRTAAGYIRLSLMRDEDRTLSPETQRARIAELAKQHGFDLADSDIVSDLDESAYVQAWRKRQGFVQLVQRAEKGEIGAIIVSRLDRFARKTADAIEVVEKLAKAGCRLICGDVEIDANSATGRFQLQLMASLAELESGRIRERVTAGHRTRAKARRAARGCTPAWLAFDSKTGIYTFTQCATTFRRLYELRAAANGATAITRQLNAEGMMKASGKAWTTTEVARYLKSHWIDTAMNGAQYYHRPSHKLQLESRDGETMRIESVYPPLITEEIGNACLTIGANRDQTATNPTRPTRNDAYILQGLLYCKTCGMKMKSYSARGARYYRCPRLGVEHDHQTCIQADLIEPAVIFAVRQNVIDEQITKLPIDKPTRNFAAELQQLEQRRARLIDGWEIGAISRDDFAKRAAAIDAERTAIENEQKAVESQLELITINDNMNATEIKIALQSLVTRIEFAHYHEKARIGNGKPRPLAKVEHRMQYFGFETKRIIDCVTFVGIHRKGWKGARWFKTQLNGLNLSP